MKKYSPFNSMEHSFHQTHQNNSNDDRSTLISSSKLPRSISKRSQKNCLDHQQSQENNSPVLQKTQRLPPHYQKSPASAVKRISLGPNSPLATPPRRRKCNNNASNRLSMYGVPTFMANSSHRPPSNLDSNGEKRIIVCARSRPLSTTEESHKSCIDCNAFHKQLTVCTNRRHLDGIDMTQEFYRFSYDHVYDDSCSTEQIYKDVAYPLVKFALDGGKSTCFAYGQTGSGKTYTMFHPESGICFMALEDLFKEMAGTNISCTIGFFEIYQEKLYDLLNDRRRVVPCEGKDKQVTIMGLSLEPVSNVKQASSCIQRGILSRITGKTGANKQSSRSHAILQFNLTLRSQASSEGGSWGKLSFCDLAGSERGADRQNVDRVTKLEGSEINKSLLALKECIRAVDQDNSHLPFRQSKLTLVLKDSIVGDVRTAMVATVSPSLKSSEHSLNTLRYAEKFFEIGGGVVDNFCDDNFSVSSPPPPPPSSSLVSQKKHSQKSCCDVDEEAEAHKNYSRSPRNSTDRWSSKKMTPKRTPLRTVTFDLPSSSANTDNSSSSATAPHTPRTLSHAIDRQRSDVLESKRGQVLALIQTLKGQIQCATDPDILELLGEEIISLSSAFKTLQ